MLCSSLGIVDQEHLSKALQNARQGRGIPIVTLMRTIEMECWLRSLKNCESFKWFTATHDHSGFQNEGWRAGLTGETGYPVKAVREKGKKSFLTRTHGRWRFSSLSTNSLDSSKGFSLSGLDVCKF
jgi:hypothetical protein